MQAKERIDQVRQLLRSTSSVLQNDDERVCWTHSNECPRHSTRSHTNPFQNCQCNFGKISPNILTSLQRLLEAPPTASLQNEDESKTFRARLNKQKADQVADFFGMVTNIIGGPGLNPNIKGQRPSEPNPGLLLSSMCETLESGRSLWGTNGVISNSFRREWAINELLVGLLNERLRPGEEPLPVPYSVLRNSDDLQHEQPPVEGNMEVEGGGVGGGEDGTCNMTLIHTPFFPAQEIVDLFLTMPGTRCSKWKANLPDEISIQTF